MDKPRIAVMLADGTEPLEAIAPIDAWRRGGVDVVTVSIMDGRDVRLAQDILMTADFGLTDIDLNGFDGILVPGGSAGVEAMAKCLPLADALKAFMDAGKFVFSICAGPMVLNGLGLLEGKRVTCYPGCEEGFPAGSYVGYSGVVHDGNLVTASGPGFALDFALVCLSVMTTPADADEVAADMLSTVKQ